MKLLIIGDTFVPKWIEAFEEGAINNGLSHEFIDVKKLVISATDNNPRVTSHQQEFEDADIIVMLDERYETVHYFLCLLYPNKRILNKKSLLTHPNLSNKFIQSIVIQKFADITPKAVFTPQAENLTSDDITFPMVTKNSNSEVSYTGYGVGLVNNIEDVKAVFNHRPIHEIKIEEFLAMDEIYDFRTIVLDGVPLGTVKRNSVEGFKSNMSDKQEKYLQSEEILDKLSSLCKSLGLEYCGIDYILHEGKLKIFEINRFPFFGRFQDAVGIHLGEIIIKHLVSTINE